MPPSDAARAASEYFNALPIEQRRQLGPLLDDYRRMGIEEALRGLRTVTHNLTLRVRGIEGADQYSEPRPNDAPSPGASPPLEQKVVRITGEQET